MLEMIFRGVLCFGLLLFAGCREEIVHDLPEVRANQVLLILERSGIEARKSREGATWSLSVPGESMHRALTVIEQSRVLEHDLNRFRETTKSFVPSREERLDAGERARSWNLETTLERIPNVLEARVHLQTESSSSVETGKIESRSAGVLLVVSQAAADVGSVARALVSGGTGIAVERISVAITEAALAAPIAQDELVPESPLGNSESSILPLLAVAVAISVLLFILRLRRLREAGRNSVALLRPVVMNGVDRSMELQ